MIYVQSMSELTSEERSYLSRVERSTFGNPFSDDRDRADRALAGVRAGDDVLERALSELDVRLSAILATRSLRSFDGSDRQALEHAHLFATFHKRADALDVLIDRQLGRADPVSAPAGADILVELDRVGLSPARATRALELFYQMRRAFRFVRDGLVGESPSMKSLRATLWSHVFTNDTRRYERHLWDRMEDFSTLLVGETGTGKGAAAAALGRAGYIAWDPSRRRFAASFDSLFVPANLSEFSPTLVEAELFGHEKGAFTGAVRARDGLFGRCPAHGVVFLDEIGEVSTAIQVKLLRVLQERSYRPVGGAEERRFEGRIVAATHAPLDRLRAERAFRDDLYYRLCSSEIRLPSLAQRVAEDPAELRVLLAALWPRMSSGGADPELVDEIAEVIRARAPQGYPWPGNVRELEQRARRYLLTGEVEFEGPPLASVRRASWLDEAASGKLDARQLLSAYCAALYDRCQNFEEVARRVGLDRRTVKKHIQAAEMTPQGD